MTYKVSQSAVIERLISGENFLCNTMTGDKVGDAYHVRSNGVLIGLAKDGRRLVNTTRHGQATARHQAQLRTAWGEAGYDLATDAGITKAATK